MEVYKIHLQRGETHRCELGGLGAAGYIWDYKIEGPLDVATISREQPAPPPPPPVGAAPRTFSVNEMFVIKALKPGETQIRFCLRRPFERDEPPLRELLLEMSVSE